MRSPHPSLEAFPWHPRIASQGRNAGSPKRSENVAPPEPSHRSASGQTGGRRLSFTEYKTVEREILDHLQNGHLRWHYMPGDRVTREYRNGDEQEMLLIPVLRKKLR